MQILDEVLLSVILILFPIVIYFIYSCYQSLKGEKNNDIFFFLTLVTSMYLCLKYVNVQNNDKILLFCNIPIIICYLKKKDYFGIIISLFVIIYCYLYLNFNIYVLLIKYVTYFLTYIIYKRKRYQDNYFIKTIALLQGFFISFEYFFYSNGSIKGIFSLLVIVLIFYAIPFLILYLFSLMDKITNLFFVSKELEKEKQIRTSLFKVTHEIKNPIAVCKGYLDMMDLDNKEKARRYIPIIKQEIDRCLSIMNDFMEFSKIKINPEIIDVNLLLDDIYDGFKLLIISKNIKLLYYEIKEEVYLMGDYNKLKQVLLNMLKNSMESIEKKGTIKIKSYLKENNYCIEISDDGCGMNRETLSRIKDMFFTTKRNGTGLGVSLSNEIINAHHGTIEYESKLNKGTKVTIKLPINI